MALIKCPECGKEVSDSALICPQCGYPIKTPLQSSIQTVQDNNHKKYFVVSNIALIIVAIMWFWRESNGVAIAEAEYNYLLLGYMNNTLMTARVIDIIMPIVMIIFIVFFVIGVAVKKK